MRSTLNWLTSSTIAVLSMRAMAGMSDQEFPAMISKAIVEPSGVSETSKAILLGIGIMAVAYTYRSAWVNNRAD